MSLKIIKAGLLDTIQDGGRHGYASLGVPPSGPMDPFSASLANAILGKELNEALIEIHFPSPVIEVTQKCILSVTGADLSPTINGTPIPLCQPVCVNEGSRITFERPVSGMRAYIGIYPGIEMDGWLGSKSTNLKMKEAACCGSALKKGDAIKTGAAEFSQDEPFSFLPWNSRQRLQNGDIKFLKGPEWDFLDEQSKKRFQEQSFSVTLLSDRMGFRLKGEKLSSSAMNELLSSAVFAGTIQLLPDGEVVILMADHPTTGGYPRIGAVISADIGRLAQLPPGSAFRFSLCDIAQAEALFLSQETYLERLKALCHAEMKRFLKS